MKAIIYYRKSTDRDDRQANSLEHQLQNCRRTADKYSLEVIKEIWESRSAKTEGTRPGFNELVKICRMWKIDYIIIDEPKRLSRNNIDTSRIIDLLDKKQIKWIFWTSREYKGDNSRDKFLLQLDLSLSKMDNEDRSKDVQDKMITCINNTGRFLWKAPFGYKNITIKKWHKEIIVDKKEAEVVKEIYRLRLENKAYSTIARMLKRKYWSKFNIDYTTSRMHGLAHKKFYYGVFSWNGKEIIGSHKPLITKEVYDKATGVWKGVHEGISSKKEYREEQEQSYQKSHKEEREQQEQKSSHKEEKSYRQEYSHTKQEEPKRETKKDYGEYERFYSDSAYIVLGVNANDDFQSVKKAYRELIRKYHPDLHPEESEKYTEITQLINSAYNRIEKYYK